MIEDGMLIVAYNDKDAILKGGEINSKFSLNLLDYVIENNYVDLRRFLWIYQLKILHKDDCWVIRGWLHRLSGLWKPQFRFKGNQHSGVGNQLNIKVL